MQTRIGLIGCGAWGRYILRDLVSLECEVWVVATSDNSINNAKQFGAKQIVNTVENLPLFLNGYVVATPTNNHGEIIAQLLAREKPIFVEKPLTNDPVVAENIVKQASDRVFVMDKWRYHAGINAIADIINSGELGKLKQLNLKRLQQGCPHSDVDPVWILMPHDLSIVLHLLGDIPPPRFVTGNYINDHTLASMTAVLGESPTISIEVSALYPIYERIITAVFEQGIASLTDPMADHILVYRGADLIHASQQPEQRKIMNDLPLFLELQQFVNFLHGGSAPMSSAAEGLKIVQYTAQLRLLAAGVKH